MKYQALFSLKKKNTQKIKMSAAAIVISALRLKNFNCFRNCFNRLLVFGGFFVRYRAKESINTL